jgi:hypothetical protein
MSVEERPTNNKPIKSLNTFDSNKIENPNKISIDYKMNKIFEILPDLENSIAFRSKHNKKHLFPKSDSDMDYSELLKNFNKLSDYEKANYTKVHTIKLNKDIICIDFDAHGDTANLDLNDIYKKFPFLNNCPYTRGVNLKGFHFYLKNNHYSQFSKSTKINNTSGFDIDFLTDSVHELYNVSNVVGECLIEIDNSDIEKLYPDIINKNIKCLINDKTNVDCGEKIFDYVEEEIIKYISNIKNKYSENYQDWVKISASLWNTFKDKKLIHLFSKKSKTYIFQDVENFIFTGLEQITLGTLKYYSKISNSEKYWEINNEYNTNHFEICTGTFTNYDVAQMFIEISDDILWNDTENYKCIMCYNENTKTWNEIDKFKNINCTVRNILIPKIQKYLPMIYKKMKLFDIGTKDHDDCVSQTKYILSNICKLKTLAHLKNISSVIIEMLQDKPNDVIFDGNPKLFCWNNKTYDISKKKFIERNKYDYITLTCGYDYIKSKIDKEFIDEFIGKILPNVEIKKCYTSFLRTGLIAELPQKFICANGTGRNGKGMINKFMRALLGDYCFTAPTSLITDKWKEGNPNPEIANLNKKRYAIYSEPTEGETAKGANIKRLTGENILSGRALYSNKTKIFNNATHLLECNERLRIDGDVNNESLKQRYIDINFTQTFTNNTEDLNKENYHQANSELTDNDDFVNKYRNSLFAYLVEDCSDTIYIPEIVEIRSQEYLSSCDEIITFFEENYEKGEINDILTAKDVYYLFKQNDYFNSLTKIEKRLLNEKNFKKNLEKKYEIIPCLNKKRSVITGYRIITDCEIEDE